MVYNIGDLIREEVIQMRTVAMILLIIGGINWGLVGLFGLDLVAAIFGTFTLLTRIVYILVGLAAIYVAVDYWRAER
ncbi:MAG: hypothetical protein BWY68_00730 [bacterium ADurb.Bin400]|nr:MAG: hypothetical protein BWY68_00730 [bacterium ADurb.Bin400]